MFFLGMAHGSCICRYTCIVPHTCILGLYLYSELVRDFVRKSVQESALIRVRIDKHVDQE